MEHNYDQLDELGIKFNTDKASKYKGNRDANNYLPLYLKYFVRQEIHRSANLNILEIGTNCGSSLRLWAEYFPNAKVYGWDITRQYELDGMLDHDRIFTDLVDQSDREAMKASLDRWDVKNFDIIIDDGSHVQAHQQVSWGFLFPYLTTNGLYVIEDLITGRPFMDGNTWNPEKIIPTRNVVQIYQQTGIVESPVMTQNEMDLIRLRSQYCVYRESSARILGEWHPEIAFIGR